MLPAGISDLGVSYINVNHSYRVWFVESIYKVPVGESMSIIVSLDLNNALLIQVNQINIKQNYEEVNTKCEQ